MAKGHRIRERYEATASGYDELYRAEQYEKYSLALRRVPPKGIILDAGCGTGLLAEYMKTTGYLDKIVEYYCVDYSWRMLEIARWRLKTICPNKCSILMANIQELPFKNEVFDTVYSFTVLDLVDDVWKTIGELLRVSRGPLVVSLLKKLPYKDELLRKMIPIIAISSKDVILRIDKSQRVP